MADFDGKNNRRGEEHRQPSRKPRIGFRRIRLVALRSLDRAQMSRKWVHGGRVALLRNTPSSTTMRLTVPQSIDG
jgi:hypothetical protein